MKNVDSIVRDVSHSNAVRAPDFQRGAITGLQSSTESDSTGERASGAVIHTEESSTTNSSKAVSTEEQSSTESDSAILPESSTEESSKAVSTEEQLSTESDSAKLP